MPDTPPLGLFADHEVREAFAKVIQVIDQHRAAREKDHDSLATKIHDTKNVATKLTEELHVHEERDTARFTLIEHSLSGMKVSIDKIEASSEKVATNAKGDRRWVIGQAVGIVILLAVGALAMRDRLQSVESHQGESDRTLDRVEKSLDRIGDRLGVAPQPAPP